MSYLNCHTSCNVAVVHCLHRHSTSSYHHWRQRLKMWSRERAIQQKTKIKAKAITFKSSILNEHISAILLPRMYIYAAAATAPYHMRPTNVWNSDACSCARLRPHQFNLCISSGILSSRRVAGLCWSACSYCLHLHTLRHLAVAIARTELSKYHKRGNKVFFLCWVWVYRLKWLMQEQP